VSHFNDKVKVGLAFLRQGVMILVPPGAEAGQFYKCEQKDRMHMVGVFANAQAASEQ